MLLRGIRKSKWYKSPAVPWLPQDELQADALGDLSTSSNILSVWLINEDKSNLEEVVAALASNRNDLTNFDYAVVSLEDVLNAGINVKDVGGETADDHANEHWHRNLEELTVSHLVSLARTIQGSGQIKRVTQKKVALWIRRNIESGQLDSTRIEQRILSKARSVN